MLKRILVLGLVSFTIILGLFNFTNPSDCGPFGVLLFFVALFMFFFSVVFFLLRIFRFMLGKQRTVERKDYFYSLIVGFGPIILLLMRAFDIYNIWTIFLAIIFVILGCILVKNHYSVIK